MKQHSLKKEEMLTDVTNTKLLIKLKTKQYFGYVPSVVHLPTGNRLDL